VSEAYDNNVIDYLPAREARQHDIVRRYEDRQQLAQRAVPKPSRPTREPPDESTWWGGRRESQALQRHNAQMNAIARAGDQAEYTQDWAMRLEFHGLKTAIHTVAAGESELMRTEPGSLHEYIGQQLLLDMAERIRHDVTDIQEEFRRRALGRG
jgi:hypothetical protein